MEPAAVISLLIQVVTLAEEAATAASRISKVLAENKGQPLTDEQWRALISDRLVAQSMFAASVARAQAEAREEGNG